MKLRGKKSLIKQFKKLECMLVLHGHLHETSEYNRKGIKFINAGGSILGTKLNEMKINVLDISSSSIKNEFITIPSPVIRSLYKKELSLPKLAYNKSSLNKEIYLN
jgi:predicted phosphodiesterase